MLQQRSASRDLMLGVSGLLSCLQILGGFWIFECKQGLRMILALIGR